MPFSVKDRKATIALLQQDIQTCSEEERKQKIRSIQMLYALEKFHEKSYSQAMSEFLRLNADPADVIKLYPHIHQNLGKKRHFNKEKQHALSFLINYLEKLQIRLNNERSETSGGEEESVRLRNVKQRLETVNTTLLKCYLLTNNDVLLSHIQKNDCTFEISEKLLRRHKKHHELLILYKKAGLHSEALQYLQTEAKKQVHCHRFADIRKYLQDLGAECIKEIVQYSEWILKESPYEGLALFTEDIIDAEKLPRAQVLDHIMKENKLLAILYLEHVIHKWKDTNSMFHETLIKLYIEQIAAKRSDIMKRERDELHYRLLIFLEKSGDYEPERVLEIIPKYGFPEEKAIVLGKMGKYEDGLIIYLFLLEDLNKGIVYCEKMYNTKESARDIYLVLIQLLLKKLKQGDSNVIDMDSILDILENNANKISAIDVLPKLPDSVPLHRLKNFLDCALEAQFAKRQGTQIYDTLAYVEYIQGPELVKQAESQSFEVTIKQLCPVCKRPFGNQKVQAPFVRYPDGQIMHILCNRKYQKKEDCTTFI